MPGPFQHIVNGSGSAGGQGGSGILIVSWPTGGSTTPNGFFMALE